MIKFRRELPDGATLMIAKNTLMRKASENTKFSTISECSKGIMLGYSSMKMLHQPSRSLDHWQKIGKKRA